MAPVAPWARLVREVGFLIAPAGLNFVVGSTTCWLYSSPLPFRLPGLELWGTDRRIACDAEALDEQSPLLRLADELWRDRLARTTLRLPRPPAPHGLVARIAAIDLADKRVPLERILRRSAALLEALQLVPEYHPRGRRSVGYLFDLVENGLTVFLVKRR